MTYTLTSGADVIRDADGARIPADPGNTDYGVYLDWRAAGHDPAPASAAPKPARRASLSDLLDPLSATQRSSISPDHMMRLIAEAADGPIYVGNSKLGRAAKDIGLSPDAWFTLAGA